MSPRIVPAWELITGDARHELPRLYRKLGTFAATITDPPSGRKIRGKVWDASHGGRRQWVAYHTPVFAGSLDLTAPGGYGVFWTLPRTQHWTACAVEDGGWEILDLITHLQAQGKAATANRLRPMAEQWIVARRPGPERLLNLDALEMEGGRVAGNAWLSHSDGCTARRCAPGCFVAELDRQSGVRPSGARRAGVRKGMGYGGAKGDGGPALVASTGGASRFFFVPKAKGKARGDSGHIAVKPLDLMRLLVTFATQPGESVLDPYAGSGRTGEACLLEGRNFCGIELDPETALGAVSALRATQRDLEQMFGATAR